LTKTKKEASDMKFELQKKIAEIEQKDKKILEQDSLIN